MRKKVYRLNAESRTFIVKQVACYSSPTETAAAVYEEFGLTITPQNVEKYDPTKRSGRECAAKWRELFEVTRKSFLKHIDNYVPEANKAVRVMQLANAARAYKGQKNFIAMADMFERIAKELGNAFTNRRELTGKGGGAIKYQDIDQMSEEQVDAELRQYGFDPDIHPPHTTKQ